MIQTIQLDIHGQLCPSCLLMALKTLNQNGPAMRKGEVDIVVLTDDRQATTTIPEAATRMGFHSEVDRDDQGYRIHIHA